MYIHVHTCTCTCSSYMAQTHYSLSFYSVATKSFSCKFNKVMIVHLLQVCYAITYECTYTLEVYKHIHGWTLSTSKTTHGASSTALVYLPGSDSAVYTYGHILTVSSHDSSFTPVSNIVSNSRSTRFCAAKQCNHIIIMMQVHLRSLI